MLFARHFLLALQFFSRIPVTGRLAAWVGYSPAMQRACAAHLPGVGWLVGAWAALWLSLAAWTLAPSPWMPWVAACLSTAATVLLTGFFHEDGLADVADGLGGFVPAARALEIMKDSRLGSYGVLTLLLTICTKLGCIALLVQQHPGRAAALVACSHVLSRLAPLALMCSTPYVGLAGQSKAVDMLGRQLEGKDFFTGLAWAVPAAALLAWAMPLWVVAFLLLAAAVVAWQMRALFLRRLGGITGDCLGATQQVAELALLLTASVALLHLPQGA
jgi:adenosylcobinamide-GDP ribazoletransferase